MKNFAMKTFAGKTFTMKTFIKLIVNFFIYLLQVDRPSHGKA
jgi:hypothetical protein